ncbi:MAG: ferritin, partial [Bacteroidales bacterium]|nr:ferritin [Bacteroidales bacterium]
MLSKKIETAINDQINAEFWSAHLYLSMSAWLSEQNLPGFSNWMYVQYKEEDSHALKFFRYV